MTCVLGSSEGDGSFDGTFTFPVRNADAIWVARLLGAPSFKPAFSSIFDFADCLNFLAILLSAATFGMPEFDFLLRRLRRIGGFRAGFPTWMYRKKAQVICLKYMVGVLYYFNLTEWSCEIILLTTRKPWKYQWNSGPSRGKLTDICRRKCKRCSIRSDRFGASTTNAHTACNRIF